MFEYYSIKLLPRCLVGFAALIPNLGLVISLGKSNLISSKFILLGFFRRPLVGAIASSALSVIFPPICETITFWPNDLGRYKWQFFLNILIILFGFYVFFAGTALSLSNIVACVRDGAQCDD